VFVTAYGSPIDNLTIASFAPWIFVKIVKRLCVTFDQIFSDAKPS